MQNILQNNRFEDRKYGERNNNIRIDLSEAVVRRGEMG